VRIELYGVLSEAAGSTHLDLPAPAEGTVAAALEVAAHASPGLAPHLPRAAVAIGDQLVPRQAPVDDSSEIVLLPPVSGG